MAALVATGTRPDVFVPVCCVVCVVDGLTTHARGALRVLRNEVARGPLRALDRVVVEEVVVNALVHRDWSSPEPVTVTVTGDRLEVTNPGRLSSRSTNRQLLRLAVALGVATGRRQGLRRVAARLARQNRRPYTLVDMDGHVRFIAEVRRAVPRVESPEVELRPAMEPATGPAPVGASSPPVGMVAASAPPRPGRPTDAFAGLDERLTAVVPSLLPRDADDRAEVVLAVLRQRDGATANEIADTLGCSRPVVGKVLTRLVADGRVKRSQGAQRSPFQRYEAV